MRHHSARDGEHRRVKIAVVDATKTESPVLVLALQDEVWER